MLKGRIISDGCNYSVKVGSVTVDITEEIRGLIEQEIALARDEYKRATAEVQAKYADAVDRYHQIARIVIAGGVGMPTG